MSGKYVWPLVTVVSTLAAVSACKKQPFTVDRRQAYIVGPTKDIVPVDAQTISKGAVDDTALNAAVMLATRLSGQRVKFCSGTLIAGEPGGNFRILSNHHCFAETDADEKATPQLVPEACAYTKVYFGFVNGQTAQSFVSECKPGSLRTSFDGDLSVFTLATNPPPRFQPLGLWEGSDVEAVGRKAAIVHFPDVPENMQEPPDGGGKLPTAAVTLDDCRVVGEFPVNEWELDRTLPFSYRHTCDLIHGSSGSGLIDAEKHVLLGVNWGGIKISAEGGVRTDNVATKASFAKSFLDGQVDEQMRLADGRRSQAQRASGKKGDKVPTGAVAKSAGCGVVGEGDDESLAALILALVVPALVLGRVRRGRSR